MSSDAAPFSALDPFREPSRSVDALSRRPAPPTGRTVRLLGRGRIFVRERPGPEDAPTVVLLHGWVASGGLNWLLAFEPLGRHFRVLAPDLRGHGRGARSYRGRFELEGCADDVAAMLRALDAGPAIVAGYSMGGPVAQLLWQRHPEEVAGLVLCATSPAPVPPGRARRVFGGMMKGVAGASRIVDWSTWGPRRIAGALSPRAARAEHMPGWARQEFGRHHWPTVFDAGRALAGYDASSWIDQVDVPTSVVLTERDNAVPPEDQRHMAEQIEDAHVHPMNTGHLACIEPDFGPTLLRACQDVAARVEGGAAARVALSPGP